MKQYINVKRDTSIQEKKTFRKLLEEAYEIYKIA